jgi:hypothetical protein
MVGEDPLPLFIDKLNEKSFSERMKEKFDMHRSTRGLDITSINVDCVIFMMQVLDLKLLRKYRKDQVPVGVIEATKKCVEGVQMN